MIFWFMLLHRAEKETVRKRKERCFRGCLWEYLCLSEKIQLHILLTFIEQTCCGFIWTGYLAKSPLSPGNWCLIKLVQCWLIGKPQLAELVGILFWKAFAILSYSFKKQKKQSISVMYLLFTYKNTVFFLISTYFSLFYFLPPFRSKMQSKKLENLLFKSYYRHF